MNPGVESACTANRAVIVENAMPISIVRPSRARAPATLSASDASGDRGGDADEPEVHVGVIWKATPGNGDDGDGRDCEDDEATTNRVRDIVPRYRPRTQHVEGPSGLDQ